MKKEYGDDNKLQAHIHREIQQLEFGDCRNVAKLSIEFDKFQGYIRTLKTITGKENEAFDVIVETTVIPKIKGVTRKDLEQIRDKGEQDPGSP